VTSETPADFKVGGRFTFAIQPSEDCGFTKGQEEKRGDTGKDG
jgi:hypothetical protein